jgi:hypothetical protein
MKVIRSIATASLALILASCSTGAPAQVSRETIMRNVRRPTGKLDSYSYIGATKRNVYLEASRFRLVKTGSQISVWSARRSEFSDADLQELEKSRKR